MTQVLDNPTHAIDSIVHEYFGEGESAAMLLADLLLISRDTASDAIAVACAVKYASR